MSRVEGNAVLVWLVALTLMAFLLGVVVHQAQENVEFGNPWRSPCEEDEALIWVDAPHSAKCVALDDVR